MEDLKISKEFAQRILNYLAQRPYVEVFPLVKGLQSLIPADQSVEVTDEVKEEEQVQE